MKLAILALALLITPATLADGDSPYVWLVSSPSGEMFDGTGISLNFRLFEAGSYLVHLTTHYAHRAPDGSFYAHTASEVYNVGANANFIFGNGFDSRTPLARWTTTRGASE